MRQLVVSVIIVFASGISGEDSYEADLSAAPEEITDTDMPTGCPAPSFRLKSCCPKEYQFDPSISKCVNNGSFGFSHIQNFPKLEFESSGHNKFPCSPQKIRLAKLRMDFVTCNFSIYSYSDGEMVNIDGIVYPSDSYCVESAKPLDENGFTIELWIYVCPKICSVLPCIKKCCDWGESMDKDYECAPTPSDSTQASEILRNEFSNSTSLNSSESWLGFRVAFEPSCEPEDKKISTEVGLGYSGNAKIRYDVESLIELENSCIEVQNGKLVASYCATDLLSTIGRFVVIQLVYCCISAAFILLALIAYLIVWRKHGINGWMQFAFIFSAFGYFAMRASRRSYELYMHLHPKSTIPDRLDTFFTFGMFTNLVNLSFHMLYSFWDIKPESSIKSSKLFITIPTCWIISAGVVILETVLTDYYDLMNLALQLTKYIFLTLLISNMVIAVATIIVILRKLSNRKHLRASYSSSTKDVKMMAKLGIKLLCFTGSVWTLKMFEQLGRDSTFERGWFWDSIQFITYTYGVVIFVVFVLTNDRIMKALGERFPKLVFSKSSVSSRTPKDTATASTSAASEIHRSAKPLLKK